MPPSPQLGYNHNIPHRGRLYHVQTEDSGAEKAHIFTHIFYDGTIVGSKKVQYDPKAEVREFDAYVIELMQQSHKSMIRELRRGSFDDKILAYIGPHPDPVDPVPAPDSSESAADVAVDVAGDEVQVDGAAAQAAANDAAESTLVDERIRGDAARRDEPGREVSPGRSQPPAVPPRFAKAKRKRAAKSPPPPPRSPAPKGPPLRAATARGDTDPSVQHPASPPGIAPPAPADSAARGPRRARRRPIGGIGGAGVTVGTKVESSARREVVVGKFAAEHQHKLDDEILQLLGEDGSS